MLLYWPLQQSLGCFGHGGGFAYHWLKYLSKYFSHSIGNRSTAGHNRPEGVSGLWILGSPKNLGALHPVGYMVLYVLMSNAV